MAFEKLKSAAQAVLMKNFVTKAVISIMAGFLIGIFVFLFTRQNILHVDAGSILYIHKGTTGHTTIPVSSPPVKELSFFSEVKFNVEKGNKGPFPVFVDPSNQVEFGLMPNGEPYFHWGSRKISRARGTDNTAARWNTWNHIGFVYKKEKLTAYVNGRKAWKTNVKNKSITPSVFQLLPGQNKAEAAYPVLVTHALTLQHIIDLRSVSPFYINLPGKLFFIFLLGTAAAIFFLVYLPPLVGFRRGPISSLSWNTRKNALFIFCINFVFFILFGFGHSAANHCRHFLSLQGTWHPSTYFTLLSIIFPAFLLSLALEKITGTSYQTCFFYVCGVTALLMFGVVLSTLPLFEQIYPIVFNSLFSLVFSLITAAPLILALPGNAEVSHDIG